MIRHLLLFFTTLSLLLFSCEADISIDLPEGEDKIVVEGYVENGLPPVVVLTRNQPYFSPVSAEAFTNNFINDAQVQVTGPNGTFELREVASDTLPQSVKDLISLQFGAVDFGSADSLGFVFYFYTTFDPAALGQIGNSYSLAVKTPDSTELSATTTLQPVAGIDSVWTEPDLNNDSLYLLYVNYSDPLGPNYVRYFTRRVSPTESEAFYPGFFNSVFDDKSLIDIDGEEDFTFTLERGYDRTDPEIDDLEIEEYAYFLKGDTITIRWCNIDEDHYTFWRTLEFDRGSRGNPFGASTRVQSNINGGLGIWGGYTTTYYSVVAK